MPQAHFTPNTCQELRMQCLRLALPFYPQQTVHLYCTAQWHANSSLANKLSQLPNTCSCSVIHSPTTRHFANQYNDGVWNAESEYTYEFTLKTYSLEWKDVLSPAAESMAQELDDARNITSYLRNQFVGGKRRNKFAMNSPTTLQVTVTSQTVLTVTKHVPSTSLKDKSLKMALEE